MSKFSAQKHQFLQNGFVHCPSVFDEEIMDPLHDRLCAHFGEAPDYAHEASFIEQSGAQVVPWFPQLDGIIAFDAIEQDRFVQDITTALLGAGWQGLPCMAMFSKAGSGGQAWHQDCPPEQSELYNLNRLVYTADTRSDGGGQIAIRPGSHRLGALGPGDPHEDFTDQILLSPKKGDLILLHGHCWHRVMPVKQRGRVSTNFRAVPAGTPEDVTDICVYRNMRYRFSTAEIVPDLG